MVIVVTSMYTLSRHRMAMSEYAMKEKRLDTHQFFYANQTSWKNEKYRPSSLKSNHVYTLLTHPNTERESSMFDI